MSVSGSYFYPGQYGGAPAPGSGIPYVGRGPVDAYIVGGVTLSATLSASDGTTNVEIISLSGTQYSTSSSFVGDAYSVVFGPLDVSNFSNVAITVINNHGTNILKSGSVEFSPNNSQWETDWNLDTFSGLAVGGVRSMQISNNSRRYLRVRAWPSGAAGASTGSTDTYVNVNVG